jgi:hypothetical protein
VLAMTSDFRSPFDIILPAVKRGRQIAVTAISGEAEECHSTPKALSGLLADSCLPELGASPESHAKGSRCHIL